MAFITPNLGTFSAARALTGGESERECERSREGVREAEGTERERGQMSEL